LRKGVSNVAPAGSLAGFFELLGVLAFLGVCYLLYVHIKERRKK